MAVRVLQNSFAGGELSPVMLGRVDDNSYGTGAFKLENFLVLPQGTIRKRHGLQYVTTLNDDHVRLIPFRFSSTQTLVLVFSHLKMYILTQGKILLGDDGRPYELETQYKGEDLYKLNYCQTSDIITITSSLYPPTELRRYGATDWRFVRVTTSPTIQAPKNVTIQPQYPDGTASKDMGIIDVTYVVTSVDSNGKESAGSTPVSGKCNYYLTGGTVKIMWNSVKNASRYRVYRSVCGVFGFIGETDKNYVIDIGDNPDGGYTPPLYEEEFKPKNGIKKVEVLDGGNEYPNPEDNNVSVPSVLKLRNIPYFGITRGGFKEFGVGAGIKIIDGNTGQTVFSKEFPLNVIKSDNNVYHERQTIAAICLFQNQNMGDVVFELGEIDCSNPRICVYPVGKTNFLDTDLVSIQPLRDPFKNVGITIQWQEHTGQEETDWESYSLSSSISVIQLNNYHFDALCKIDRLALTDRLFTSKGIPLSELLAISESEIDQGYKNNVKLEVIDSTGKDAELEAVVENGKIVAVNVINSGYDYTDPTIKVISETGSGAKFKIYLYTEEDYDYPQAVAQYDQRRVFGGTNNNPLKVWFTNAGKQDLMMYHIPTRADDRIEITAVTSDADKIKHAVALDSLILFTGSSELRVYTQNSDALAPDSVAVRAQSYIGANNVQPVIVNSNVVYVASRGGHVRHLRYAYANGGYTTDDLSLRATHLFDGYDVVDIALSKAPVQTLYCVSSSGALLCATYLPEQNILAWWQFKSKGTFKSVCCVSEDEEDHLYVAIERTIQGAKKTYLERLSNVTIDDSATLMDSYLVGEFDTLQDDVLGLDHLEGEEVCIFADGVQQANKLVTNGRVVLDTPAKNIKVGLPYKATLVTVPLAIQSNDLQGGVKNVGETSLRVSHDGDIWAGVYPQVGDDVLYKCDRDDLEYLYQNDKSQVVKLSLDGVWDLQGQIIVESRDCLPLEISAIIGNVSLEKTSKT